VTKDGKLKKSTAQARTIPINEEVHEYLLPILIGRQPFEPLIWSQKNKLKPMDRRSMWRIYKIASRVAGILNKRVSTHTPRKTAGLYWYETSGKDIVYAMEMLGQTSVESTTHYLKLGEAKKKEGFLKKRGLGKSDVMQPAAKKQKVEIKE